MHPITIYICSTGLIRSSTRTFSNKISNLSVPAKKSAQSPVAVNTALGGYLGDQGGLWGLHLETSAQMFVQGGILREEEAEGLHVLWQGTRNISGSFFLAITCYLYSKAVQSELSSD